MIKNARRPKDAAVEEGQQRDHQDSSKQQKTKRLTLNEGIPWPDGIVVSDDGQPPSRSCKDKVGTGIFFLFGILLLLLVGHAMATSDHETLGKTFELVRWGIGVILGWAFGMIQKK